MSSTEDSTENNMLEHYLTSSVTKKHCCQIPVEAKSPHPLLTNFTVTEHRTRQLVAKTPELLQVYNQIIAKQEAIKRVELPSDYSRVNYIPHHAVEKDSLTTPISIVVVNNPPVIPVSMVAALC